MKKDFFRITMIFGITILVWWVFNYIQTKFIEHTKQIKQKNIQETIDLTIGSYKLDIKRSSFCSIIKDSTIFHDIFLRFKRDKTFLLSRKRKELTIFEDTIGTWSIEGSGIEKYLVLHFPNNHTLNISPCCASNNLLPIKNGCSAETGMTMNKKGEYLHSIVFEKLSTSSFLIP